jgi:hypothetical protein
VAFPLLSKAVIRYPVAGLPPLILIVPLTSRLVVGELVPTPTFPLTINPLLGAAVVPAYVPIAVAPLTSSFDKGLTPNPKEPTLYCEVELVLSGAGMLYVCGDPVGELHANANELILKQTTKMQMANGMFFINRISLFIFYFRHLKNTQN